MNDFLLPLNFVNCRACIVLLIILSYLCFYLSIIIFKVQKKKTQTKSMPLSYKSGLKSRQHFYLTGIFFCAMFVILDGRQGHRTHVENKLTLRKYENHLFKVNTIKTTCFFFYFKGFKFRLRQTLKTQLNELLLCLDALF